MNVELVMSRLQRISQPARILKHAWRNQDGATAIEYALIAAGVGAAIAATVYSLGDTVLNNLFETIADAFV